MRSSSSMPLFDIVPIGKNCREKPVLDRQRPEEEQVGDDAVVVRRFEPDAPIEHAELGADFPFARALVACSFGLPNVTSLTKPGRPANGSCV